MSANAASAAITAILARRIKSMSILSVGDEIFAAIALRVKKRGEVAVVDAGAGRLAQRRLAMKGDAEPARLDHRNVVGAVAHRERLFTAKTKARPQRQQCVALGFAAQHWLRHFAGEPAGAVGQQ